MNRENDGVRAGVWRESSGEYFLSGEIGDRCEFAKSIRMFLTKVFYTWGNIMVVKKNGPGEGAEEPQGYGSILWVVFEIIAVVRLIGLLYKVLKKIPKVLRREWKLARKIAKDKGWLG